MTAATPLPDLPADRDVTPTADGTVTPGSHDRLGATVTGDGVDFAVFARRASGRRARPLRRRSTTSSRRAIVVLDPVRDRTGAYWHVHVAGIGHGQLYGYRVHGPWAPHDGLRFDATKVLLDPYGRAVATPAAYRRVEAGDPTDGAIPMKSVVVDGSDYDWEGDQRIERPFRHTVIYEAHVAGFTADPSSGVAPGRRGTYAGFIDKIPYLVDLGITAVELLPVFAFDRLAAPTGLVNYWGYQPVAFFAPHAAYASGAGPDGRRRRVPRPGQGAPPGRHRGHPRRRLQPHRRGRRGRPDVRLPGLRQRHLLPARR